MTQRGSIEKSTDRIARGRPRQFQFRELDEAEEASNPLLELESLDLVAREERAH